MRKLSFIKMFVLVSLFSVVSFADDFDFSGNFTYDNDIVQIAFTNGAASNVTIFSSSWDDGGFDPILAIWDSSGNLVQEQDDGHNIGSTLSNGVSYDHGDWDTYFTTSLDAGDYIATIGQYNNFANGSTLSAGFWHDGDPDFTTAFGPQAYFNGVLSGSDGRTSDWAFHLLNVEAATVVPVPGAVLLGMLGLSVVGVKLRKHA